MRMPFEGERNGMNVATARGAICVTGGRIFSSV
jgi:hypothetical protein